MRSHKSQAAQLLVGLASLGNLLLASTRPSGDDASSCPNPMLIQHVPPPPWVTGNINSCGMETLHYLAIKRPHSHIAVKFAHYTNIKFCGNSLHHLATKRPPSHEEAIPWSIYTKRRGNQVVMPLRRAYLFLI